MNAAEHIVECYFRLVLKCFTITDMKVIDGINRQCDLLAVNIKDQKYYHVESSVTHKKMWAPDVHTLQEIFDKKFRGVPPKKENPNSEWKKGVNHLENINKTYRQYGIPSGKIQRIFVLWIEKEKDKDKIIRMRKEYKKKYCIDIRVMSFRDDILPELKEAVGTPNYDDEILRTISLLKEEENQKQKNANKSLELNARKQ
jgi:hypothetical protein